MPRDEMFKGEDRPIYQGPCALDLSGPQKAILARYHPGLRKRLRRFALVDRRCADLLTSFPAAAVLIATMEAGPEPTGLAVARVKAGAPLPSVAEALQTPLWTRKLPPEAFGLDPIGRVETSPEFARRVANFLPIAEDAAMWRSWVLEALRLGGEDFALWLAAQPVYHGEAMPIGAIEPLAAYAFASARKGASTDPLLIKRWGPRRPFAQAAFEATAWLERVAQIRCAVIDDEDAWSAPSKSGGYRIYPLTSAEELIKEGDVMDNCMETYVDPVARGDCLIFSVRRGGRTVADIEIRPKARQGEFIVVQFEGHGNSAPAPRVRRAVERWLLGLGDCPLNKGGLLRRGRLDAAKWRDEWADFVASHPAASSLWKEAEPALAATMLTERLRWLRQAEERAKTAPRRST